MADALGNVLLGTMIISGLAGIGVGLILATLYMMRATFRETAPTPGHLPATIACGVLFLVLAIPELFFYTHPSFFSEFLGLYPFSFVEGILLAFIPFFLQLTLAERGKFLPHVARGLLFVGGGVICLIAFHLPYFIRSYTPPPGFTTRVAPFSIPIYFDLIAAAPIHAPVLGVDLPYTTLGGVLILMGIGLLLLFKDNFLGLMGSRFLFFAELFFVWGFVLLITILGLLEYGDQQVFVQIQSLGGGATATQAGQYFHEVPAVGFYLLLLGFAGLMVGVYLPDKITGAPSSGLRAALSSFGALLVYIVFSVQSQWQHAVLGVLDANVVTQFIGNQLTSILHDAFWPLLGSAFGAMVVVFRQKDEKGGLHELTTRFFASPLWRTIKIVSGVVVGVVLLLVLLRACIS
jgi:hypothetical protein